jgi:hypothetical protein
MSLLSFEFFLPLRLDDTSAMWLYLNIGGTVRIPASSCLLVWKLMILCRRTHTFPPGWLEESERDSTEVVEQE